MQKQIITGVGLLILSLIIFLLPKGSPKEAPEAKTEDTAEDVRKKIKNADAVALGRKGGLARGKKLKKKKLVKSE